MSETTPSRRAFFTRTAALAAASLAATGSAAAQATQAPAPKPSKLADLVKKLYERPRPSASNPFASTPATAKGWDSEVTRLVRRATYGVTPEELTSAQKLGFTRWLDRQLHPTQIDDSAVEQFVAATWPNVGKTGAELYNLDQNALRVTLVEASMFRAAFSKRQLFERMAEFWSDHFSISYREVNYLKLLDDRDVIRKHALGKFPEMVRASAHSPAMLEYLDNTRNRGKSPNQNYARELMELHTLGVDGGYTQQDVAELSRCLTGWTIAGRGDFRFDPTGHDFAAKTVLGVQIPALAANAGAAGMADGDTMIEFLITHPNTARYISTKMLRHLLRYDPTEAQVAAVAAVYTKTKGDIPAMIKAILTPAQLKTTPSKHKRPYHYAVSALRATNPTVTRLSAIADRWMTTLGQQQFQWETPDGYPDSIDYWAGGALPRWNFATYLSTRTTGEVVFDVAPLMAVATPDGVVEQLSRTAFGGEMPDRLKGQLKGFLAAAPITAARTREAVALTLGSTTFQWF